MKKTLSVLLALCMVVTMFAQVSFAARAIEPVADVQMVKGEDFATSEYEEFKDFAEKYAEACGIDLSTTVGAVLTVSEAGTGYDDWYVDTYLTLSADVEAKFYGRYSALDDNWYGSDMMGEFASKLPATSTFVNNLNTNTGLVSLAAGEYGVMQECGIALTVKQVVEDVQKFFCILAIDPDSIDDSVNVSLELGIKRNADDDFWQGLKTTGDSDVVAVTYTKALPTVDVKMVNGADFATSGIQAFADFADTFEGVNLKYTVGAVIKLEDKGFGYDNYYVDTILSVSEDTDAKFYGSYSAFGDLWCGLDVLAQFPENIPEDSAIMDRYDETTQTVKLEEGAYSVMRECGVIRTLKEVAAADGTFYCVLNVDPETFDTLGVEFDLKLYKDLKGSAGLPFNKTKTSEKVEAEFAKVKPTADIKMIDGTAFATSGIPAFVNFASDSDLDMRYTVGAVLSIADIGYGYDNYYIDAVLNVNNNASAKFYGCYPQFGDGVWIGAEAISEFSDYIPSESKILEQYNDETQMIDLEAGKYSVARECGAVFTLKAADENVDTFYCILSVDPNTFSTLDVSLDLMLYKNSEDANPAYIEMNKTQTADSVEVVQKSFEKILPTASVKTVKGTDFATSGIPAFANFAEGIVADELAYTVGAAFTMEDVGAGYDNYNVEALLDITTDIAEENFKATLYGYFEDYDAWVGTDAITFEAGQYKVLESASYDCTVKRANEEIKTFYCVFVCDRASFNGEVGVALDVKISKDNENYIDITGTDSVEATFKKVTLKADSRIYTDVDFAKEFADQDILSAVDTCGYDFTNARIAEFKVNNNENTGYDNSAVQVGIKAINGNIHGAILYYNGETWEFVTEDMFYKQPAIQGQDTTVVATIDGLLLKDAETVYVAFVHDTVTMVDETKFDFALYANDGKESFKIATTDPTTIQKLRIYALGTEDENKVTNLCLNEKVSDVADHYTKIENIDSHFTNIWFTNEEDEVLADGAKIGTGDKMFVYNTKTRELTETTIVIKGDSNGDGDFTKEDYTDFVNNAVSEADMNDYSVQACDLNNDGVVDVLDAVSAELFISENCVYEDVIKRAI